MMGGWNTRWMCGRGRMTGWRGESWMKDGCNGRMCVCVTWMSV